MKHNKITDSFTIIFVTVAITYDGICKLSAASSTGLLNSRLSLTTIESGCNTYYITCIHVHVHVSIVHVLILSIAYFWPCTNEVLCLLDDPNS